MQIYLVETYKISIKRAISFSLTWDIATQISFSLTWDIGTQISKVNKEEGILALTGQLTSTITETTVEIYDKNFSCCRT